MSEVKEVLRLAQPPLSKFAPGVIFGIFSAGAAVSLLAVSSWLITRAGDMPPIMYLNMAIVGVRFFALARASFTFSLLFHPSSNFHLGQKLQYHRQSYRWKHLAVSRAHLPIATTK